MPEKVTEKDAPKGLLLFLFRLPRWLYRWGLGGILGERFLLLHHTGRVSGKPYETVLEVVGHKPSSGAYYVVAAYGGKSDWYLNLRETPKTHIRVGRKSLSVIAEELPSTESGTLLLEYARKHPTAIKQISRFMGYRVDGTEDDYRALGELLHVMALKPAGG